MPILRITEGNLLQEDSVPESIAPKVATRCIPCVKNGTYRRHSYEPESEDDETCLSLLDEFENPLLEELLAVEECEILKSQCIVCENQEEEAIQQNLEASIAALVGQGVGP